MLDNNDSIFLVHNGKNITCKEFKQTVKKQITYIKTLTPAEVVLSGDDTYTLLVNLFSCIYLKIPTVLIGDKTRLQYVDGIYIDKVVNSTEESEIGGLDLEYTISFLTSGSTGAPKKINISLRNLIAEAEDMIEAIDFSKAAQFITTTTLAHHYGCTVCLFVPMLLNIPINTKRILYPEEIIMENTALISSPSFLSKLVKYSVLPPNIPFVITSAGAKLEVNVFDYWNKCTRIVDMYGCTETGVLAYKDTPNQNMKLLKRVKINNNIVKCPYMTSEEFQLSDSIEILPDGIRVLGRSDRIVKIQEERISLAEIEKYINEIDGIEQSYCLKIGEKLAAVVILTDDGKNKLIKDGLFDFIKNLKSLLKEKTRIVPQKWKFLDEFPQNSLGKTDNDYIKSLFNINLTLPLVKKRDENQLELVFLKDSNFFKGHFTNYPIVPGVVQLYFASFYINELFGLKLDMGQLKKIKFSNLMFPDKSVDLIFTDKNDSILYKYQKGDKVYSSGQFPKRNIFLEGNK